MTLSQMTLSTVTLSKMTLSKMTLSKMTLSKMTLSKMTLSQTTQNQMTPNRMTVVEWHLTEQTYKIDIKQNDNLQCHSAKYVGTVYYFTTVQGVLAPLNVLLLSVILLNVVTTTNLPWDDCMFEVKTANRTLLLSSYLRSSCIRCSKLAATSSCCKLNCHCRMWYTDPTLSSSYN